MINSSFMDNASNIKSTLVMKEENEMPSLIHLPHPSHSSEFSNNEEKVSISVLSHLSYQCSSIQ